VPSTVIDQIADRHQEIESVIRVGAREWKSAMQQDRRHEWYLSALLVVALLVVVALAAALSWTGHFDATVAFVFGTALGALAATLKDFLLPVGD
jgi:hypothetical protein